MLNSHTELPGIKSSWNFWFSWAARVFFTSLIFRLIGYAAVLLPVYLSFSMHQREDISVSMFAPFDTMYSFATVSNTAFWAACVTEIAIILATVYASIKATKNCLEIYSTIKSVGNGEAFEILMSMGWRWLLFASPIFVIFVLLRLPPEARGYMNVEPSALYDWALFLALICTSVMATRGGLRATGVYLTKRSATDLQLTVNESGQTR